MKIISFNSPKPEHMECPCLALALDRNPRPGSRLQEKCTIPASRIRFVRRVGAPSTPLNVG